MEIKIISYNLFRGANATRNELVSFIQRENPDILCLQEINGWQQNDFEILKDVAQQSGMHTYVYGDSNSDYKLATLSKYPVESSSIYQSGIWHSMIDSTFEIDNHIIRVVNVHLNPNSEKCRRDEIRHLLTKLDHNTPTMIVGDFNSLSRRDKYPDSLLSRLQATGIDKFGDNKLVYDVTDLLEDEHYMDMAYELESIANTVPTDSNIDKNHSIPLRLDYAFANKTLQESVRELKVLKTDLTNTISDHYPLSIAVKLS